MAARALCMSYSVDKQSLRTDSQIDSIPVPVSNRAWLPSFVFAFDGMFRTLLEERNMKVHWIAATAVMLTGMTLPLPVSARAALLFAVLLVLATEVLNTSIEGLVDLSTDTWAYPAKVAKDAAAGTVLIVAIGAVMLLADTLFHYWEIVLESTDSIQQTLALGLPLLGLLVILLRAPRQMLWMSLSAAGASLCWIPLAQKSEDPIFSFLCFLFILGAAVTRLREPELLNKTPPSLNH